MKIQTFRSWYYPIEGSPVSRLTLSTVGANVSKRGIPYVRKATIAHGELAHGALHLKRIVSGYHENATGER